MVNYAFDSWEFHLNYRHLEYDFGDVSGRYIGNPVTTDNLEMVFSGPSIGAKFVFNNFLIDQLIINI